MALALGILSMLATILPVIFGIIKDSTDQRTKARNAIRERDLTELRDGMSAVDGVYTDQPVSTGRETSI